ncbi:hypothetical protein JY459_20540 [Serratia marcescens]|nr:hypothetical protein [Serratia marcescens]
MTLTTEQLKHILDNPNEFSLSQVQEMAAELLANREAQPVGYIDPGSLKEYRGQRAGGTWSAVQRTTSGLNMTTPIYTAPPAPAVPAEATPEDIPQEHNINTYSGITWAAAWNACRAAMLDQPVSGGYKLVPVEPTENMIIDGFESDAFMALADAVNEKNGWPYSCKESAECVEGIFKAMLSAAPEKN